VAFAFRGIDRYSVLSEQDNLALELDEEQLADISKPIAHMADRSKLGKRYGRIVLDSSDGIAAAIQMGMWAARVNRIAKRTRQALEYGSVGVGSPGESVPEGETQEAATPGNVLNFRATGVGYN